MIALDGIRKADLSRAIVIDRIIVHARSGAHIDLCRREAAILALETNQVVVLIHNDKQYIANTALLLEAVLKESLPKDSSK